MTRCKQPKRFRVFYFMGDEMENSKTTITASTPLEAGQFVRQRFAPAFVKIVKVKLVKEDEYVQGTVADNSEPNVADNGDKRRNNDSLSQG